MKSETNIQTKSTENQNDNFCRFEPVVGLPTLTFKHLDLFSGIGGFALAAKSIYKERYENVGFCEIDKFCQKVLRKNFGNDIKIFEDIRNLRKEDIIGTVDLITGGFPCQPFSVAGLRKGASDDRYLWDEMFRVIRTVKSKWIICENVANLWNMGIENMLLDLEGEGYEVETFYIPACAVGLPHKRERIWIVAHAKFTGWERTLYDNIKLDIEKDWQTDTLDSQRNIFLQFEERCGKPAVFGVDDGLPKRLDVVKRLEALGNAIVPQIAMVLLAALKAIEDKLELKR